MCARIIDKMRPKRFEYGGEKLKNVYETKNKTRDVNAKRKKLH